MLGDMRDWCPHVNVLLQAALPAIGSKLSVRRHLHEVDMDTVTFQDRPFAIKTASMQSVKVTDMMHSVMVAVVSQWRRRRGSCWRRRWCWRRRRGWGRRRAVGGEGVVGEAGDAGGEGAVGEDVAAGGEGVTVLAVRSGRSVDGTICAAATQTCVKHLPVAVCPSHGKEHRLNSLLPYSLSSPGRPLYIYIDIYIYIYPCISALSLPKRMHSQALSWHRVFEGIGAMFAAEGA